MTFSVGLNPEAETASSVSRLLLSGQDGLPSAGDEGRAKPVGRRTTTLTASSPEQREMAPWVSPPAEPVRVVSRRLDSNQDPLLGNYLAWSGVCLALPDAAAESESIADAIAPSHAVGEGMGNLAVWHDGSMACAHRSSQRDRPISTWRWGRRTSFGWYERTSRAPS